MAIDLPKAIADYFEADRAKDAGGVSRCFTETAVVRDEGNIHRSRDEIGHWKAESSRKYKYAAEPFSLSKEGDRIVVACHLAGDFPGSPLDLRYFFMLEGGKIAELEIVP
ncbi:polyketide cyclase [Sphingobium sp. 22B]|uniref:nuclear transport factor 2 family protein n=1 Tax=unclassified Sphingobium TaxID=2611147 RepID=UPI000785364B|nr:MULTISPECIES: nuclear transport factor 2 family protein [unclassified Sphingobium]KXU33862.1 polyketide cyclase [Sphingobium sp. AM]KYC33806.1 polyketide cyclase [Sphingobium sp. 22B]OAP33540.1 polyketide cyclase [Sphingobium sp. 20006FA]